MKKRVLYLMAAVVLSMSMLLCACSSGEGGADSTTPAATGQDSSAGNNASDNNNASSKDADKPADNGTTDAGTDNGSNTADQGDSDDSDVLSVLTGKETGEYKKKDINTNYNPDKCVAINLNGSSASSEGSGVSINGGIITISEEGKYIVSGTLDNGQIVINVDKEEDVRLILNGVNITCGNSSCIYVMSADKLIITLAEGTTNTLRDGASYTYTDAENEEPNAALFTDCDLSINGNGTLNVTGNFKHAIRAKADIKITSGKLIISAVNKGIKAKKTLSVLNGDIIISSGKDGLEAGSTVNIDGGNLIITAEDEAMQSDEQIIVNNGTVDLSKSKNGMKAPVITTNGGNVILPQ